MVIAAKDSAPAHRPDQTAILDVALSAFGIFGRSLPNHLSLWLHRTLLADTLLSGVAALVMFGMERFRMAAESQRTEHRYFYAAMTAVLLFVTIVGFSRYLAATSMAQPVGPSVIHLHAFFGFLWIGLFLLQTSLIASGRTPNHKAMGLFGIAVATAMFFSGLMVATKTMSVGIANGAEEGAQQFAIFPVTIQLLFAGFFTAAIMNIGRPDIHKRLMLIAAIMTMPPASGRFVATILVDGGLPHQIQGAPPQSLAAGTAASLLADMFLIAAILYDWRTRGRPHPAYLISLAIILAVQALRVPFAQTPLWHGETDVLLSLGL